VPRQVTRGKCNLSAVLSGVCGLAMRRVASLGGR
jgi:hypothetical protein